MYECMQYPLHAIYSTQTCMMHVPSCKIWRGFSSSWIIVNSKRLSIHAGFVTLFMIFTSNLANNKIGRFMKTVSISLKQSVCYGRLPKTTVNITYALHATTTNSHTICNDKENEKQAHIHVCFPIHCTNICILVVTGTQSSPMHTEVSIGLDNVHFPSLMYGFVMQQADNIKADWSHFLWQSHFKLITWKQRKMGHVFHNISVPHFCQHIRTYNMTLPMWP